MIGWVDRLGKLFIADMWITGYNPPLIDGDQNIFNYTGDAQDGVTNLQFIRKRHTGDEKSVS